MLVSVLVVLTAVVGCSAGDASPEDSTGTTSQAYTKGASTSGGTETVDEVKDDFVTVNQSEKPKWTVNDCKDVCDIVTEWSPRSCADYCDCRIGKRIAASECLRMYNLSL